jgi:hypothetical protein
VDGFTPAPDRAMHFAIQVAASYGKEKASREFLQALLLDYDGGSALV